MIICQAVIRYAAVAELADARDLKSLDGKLSSRFNSGQRHHCYLLLYFCPEVSKGVWGEGSPNASGGVHEGAGPLVKQSA